MTALANKIAALIADDAVFIAGARVISQGGAPPALAAILAEIDNTVLERTLVFGIDDVNVSMVVAGRRMRGIVDVSGNLPEAAPVVGKVLSRDEPKIMQAAGDLLTLLCVAAARVTVRSLPPRPLGTSADAGISATGLADLWQVDIDAEPAPPMERFLTAIGPTTVSRLYLADGAVADTSGDIAALQAIWEDQAAAFRKRHRALYPKANGPMLVGLDGVLQSGEAVAIATIGSDVALFSYPPDGIIAITNAWYAVIG